MITPNLIHYFSVAICTAITTLGVAIGQGITGNAAFEALNRQPAAKEDINRATILALALIETSALIGLLGSVLLFAQKTTNIYNALAQLGTCLAISIPGFIVGIASSFPAKSAILSIARQPLISKKIMNFMLLTQSLIQTPLAFGFIIALIIKGQIDSVSTLNQALTYIASGLCIGLGSIGPAWGVGKFAQMACYSVGLNRSSYGKLISFTFISQAIIETPVIFSAIMAFMLIRLAPITASDSMSGYIYLAISFVIGIGTLGPGVGSGKIAAAACKQIAINAQSYGILARTSMMAQGIIDTCAIYAFIIALSLTYAPLK